MRISKPAITAGLIIGFILILFFVLYQVILAQSQLTLSDTSVIFITPHSEIENSSTQNENEMDPLQPTNIPGVFYTGMAVQIHDTGGDGLRIRASAGLEGTPVYLGQEGENFEIIEGPEIVDSKIWWKIVSIDDPQKKGWAVQEFMKPK